MGSGFMEGFEVVGSLIDGMGVGIQKGCVEMYSRGGLTVADIRDGDGDGMGGSLKYPKANDDISDDDRVVYGCVVTGNVRDGNDTRSIDRNENSDGVMVPILTTKKRGKGKKGEKGKKRGKGEKRGKGKKRGKGEKRGKGKKKGEKEKKGKKVKKGEKG